MEINLSPRATFCLKDFVSLIQCLLNTGFTVICFYGNFCDNMIWSVLLVARTEGHSISTNSSLPTVTPTPLMRWFLPSPFGEFIPGVNPIQKLTFILSSKPLEIALVLMHAWQKMWQHYLPLSEKSVFNPRFNFQTPSVKNADYGLQTADCRPGIKCRLQTGGKTQPGCKMQSKDCRLF